MSCTEFVQRGWADHAEDAAGVFARFHDGMPLVETPADVASMSGLIVHVAGEHLGRWADGIELIEALTRHPAFDDDVPECKAAWRSLAALHLCAGNAEARAACLEKGRSGTFPAASDEIRVLAVAAAAMLGQKRVDEAAQLLGSALELAGYGPAKSDPAARALAVTCNNMACELETKAERSAAEAGLLRRAAREARRFWEVAGTWVEVERAEYRLAMTCLALGEPRAALEHAQLCLDGCLANDADPFEKFFAHEAVALAERACGAMDLARAARDAAAGCLDRMENAGSRSYAASQLEALDAKLAG